MTKKISDTYPPSRKFNSVLKSALCLSLASTAIVVDAAEDMDVAGFVENATYYRESKGISKFRNTAQLEFSKAMDGAFNSSSFKVNGTFRVTYDGVYDLNDDEWGDKAGGSILLEQVGGPNPLGGPAIPAAMVPHGGGAPLPSGGFSTVTNPNEGLEVLGATIGGLSGGVAFGVPVRPCDVDSRGCRGLRDYMDKDEDELKWSDFNDQWDFIRELYMVSAWDLNNDHQVGMKLGKQQIVWGRTDLFRVLDVINPVDYSRNNIYDELEDIRIPQWMMELEYRWGPTAMFDDANLSFIWNFDEFRPADLGQAGTPYENGCTVSNFAFGIGATDFAPNAIGIRSVDLPNWSLSNTQFGVKFEGVLNDVGFSLNFLEYRQQLPSLRGGIASDNPFTPGVESQVYPYALAFDIAFPRVTLLGGSIDYYQDSIKSTWRVEMAWTEGEEFPDSSVPELFSESEVVRWVVGWDRNTFIPFLNQRRAFLLSAQAFGQHILEHHEFTGSSAFPGTPPPGKIGMPDHQDNYFFTFLIQGWYMNDRLNPQIIMAHDLEAAHTTIAPAIEWIPDNNWQVTLRANFKIGDDVDSWDDNRTAMPYDSNISNLGPFPDFPQHVSNGGLSGANPLGRFRMGPLGMAQEEDEYQLTVRYRF
jgi:hypothetical protein